MRKIERYCDSTEFPYEVYYSNIVSDARYAKYKYFFIYHNTERIAESFKTQKEMEKFIEENIKVKFFNTDYEEGKVNADYLENISNITEIEYVRELRNGLELEVKYFNGKTVYYENIHGSWGFPTVMV